MPKKTTLEQFINRANIIHNNTYDYSLVEYKNTNTKVKIICNDHGIFEQEPKSHLLGMGCFKCGILKRTQTNLDRYGVKHAAQSPIILSKMKDTMIERYGVSNAAYSQDFQTKKNQTNLNKYGEKWFTQTTYFKTLSNNTLLNNYGCTHPSYINFNINNLLYLEDKDWMIDQYVFQDKTDLQISNELGVNITTVGNYRKKHNIDTIYRNLTKFGKQCFDWLTYVSNQQDIVLDFEYIIPTTKYRVDGFHKETNTIYEYYGDYWHGNPLVYNANIINVVNNLTMGELYIKTIEREQYLHLLGYNIITKWETE